MSRAVGSSAEHVTLERLSAYLDEELREDDARRLTAHLEDCEQCHRRLAGLREVSSSLRELDKLSPPVGLEQMVARRIALEERSPRGLDRLEAVLGGFGRQSSFLSLFAVVIALAAILLLFSQAMHQRSQETTPILFDAPAMDAGGNVDGAVVLLHVVADRRLLRVEGGWLQDGLDPQGVEHSLIRDSATARDFFAEHPELAPLSELSGFVVFELDGEIYELR